MTKGTKKDQGKAPIHLIPSEAIIGIARGLEYGAVKYGEYNFRQGIEYTRILDSLMRHTLAYLSGEDNDPESGLSHIWLIGSNYAMLEWQRVHHPELDNRYKGTPKIENEVVGFKYEGKLLYDPSVSSKYNYVVTPPLFLELDKKEKE